MRAIALRIVVLWGWRRALVAVLAGAASAQAMAPLNIFPVLFLTVPILVWLLDGAASERGRAVSSFFSGAVIGWCFGFGYFLAGLYWVGEAFYVEARIFAWMVPFVLVLLPAGLGLFSAAACALAAVLWSTGYTRIVALACTWTALEWIRGHVLTGFPWNSIGYAFSGTDVLAQTASLWGVYGLGFLVILIVGAPATLADEYAAGRAAIVKRLAGPCTMVILAAGLVSFGYLRLTDAPAGFVENVRVRVVQPNIPQNEKWVPANRNQIFARYLEMSNQATSPETMGISDVTHLVWPESALPFLLARRPEALAAIAALLPDGTRLITGGLRKSDGTPSSGGTKVFNSVLVVNSDGAIESTYDKTHLVPFGEYLPLDSILRPLGIRKLVAVPLGFEPGPGPRTLAAGTAPDFSPLICYEAIFPGAVVEPSKRPGWLLNVTNDAWFGTSIGPHQHFQQARLRAVEEGLPLVRAANTGISAVIDPFGRIVRQRGIAVAGVIDSRLPVALPPTFYARYRDLPVLILILAGLLVVLTLRIGGSRETREGSIDAKHL